MSAGKDVEPALTVHLTHNLTACPAAIAGSVNLEPVDGCVNVMTGLAGAVNSVDIVSRSAVVACEFAVASYPIEMAVSVDVVFVLM